MSKRGLCAWRPSARAEGGARADAPRQFSPPSLLIHPQAPTTDRKPVDARPRDRDRDRGGDRRPRERGSRGGERSSKCELN